MYYKPLLLPLLAQVFLTFAVWFYMYVTRLTEMRRRGIAPQQLANDAEARELLVDSAPAANNLRNLFEMPILFYAAMLLALVLLVQDPMLVQLAWVYVTLRAVHSLVHCSYNRVIHRFAAYAASSIVLLLIWIRLGSWVLAY